ncbi:LysE family translocator [Caminibacter sp.]
MDLTTIMIFLSIAVPYIASPGPAVFLTINYSLNYGIKNTLKLILGNTTGLGILAFISALGVGVLIVSSLVLKIFMQIAGAFFLIYIGFKMIKKSKIKIEIENTHNTSFYKEGITLALTNPKPIIFFSSIYPQFINTSSDEIFIEFFILGIIFMLLSFSILSAYAYFSKKFFNIFLTKPQHIKIFNVISGSIIIVLGVILILQIF